MNKKYYVKSGSMQIIVSAPNAEQAAKLAMAKMVGRRVDLVAIHMESENPGLYVDRAYDAMMRIYARLGMLTFVSERGWDDVNCWWCPTAPLTRQLNLERQKLGDSNAEDPG